jgi:hypothetical protein
MQRLLRIVLLAAALAAILPVGTASGQAPAPAGRVNFVKAADSSFDRYTLDPDDSGQAWMRDHYWRMRAYAPYFDSRTAWYPGAWAYKDAYAIYRGSTLAAQHPEWILRDGDGNRLYIPFACDGTSCPQYAADIGSPEWRRHYIDAARSLAARGYRGIFVDDVNLAFNVGDGAGDHVDPIDPRTGAPMTHEAWQRYFAEFMEELRAELPASVEIVQNQVYFHVGLSSPYVRRAIDAATHIEIERGVNDAGIRGGAGRFGFETVLAWIDYAHSRGKGVIYDVHAAWGREYALATYFLSSSGSDGIGMNAGGLPDDWWAGWDTDLGAPLGERYPWNGVFRRDFELGSVLVNQPDRPTATLTLGGGWRRLDGSEVTTVELPARDGAVLLRDGNEPAATPSPPALPASTTPALPASTTPAQVTAPASPATPASSASPAEPPRQTRALRRARSLRRAAARRCRARALRRARAGAPRGTRRGARRKIPCRRP